MRNTILDSGHAFAVFPGSGHIGESAGFTFAHFLGCKVVAAAFIIRLRPVLHSGMATAFGHLLVLFGFAISQYPLPEWNAEVFIGTGPIEGMLGRDAVRLKPSSPQSKSTKTDDGEFAFRSGFGRSCRRKADASFYGDDVAGPSSPDVVHCFMVTPSWANSMLSIAISVSLPFVGSCTILVGNAFFRINVIST